MIEEPPPRINNIAEQLRPLVVPLESLRLLARNPRQGDIGALSVSLTRFGQTKPVIVQARTRRVVGGNHLVKAASMLGWTEIAANVMDIDDETATAMSIADNRLADLGTYDDEMLLEILVELAKEDNLEGTGYDPDDIDALLADVAGPKEGKTAPDDIPETTDTPWVGPNELWLLGDHRLLVGDATRADDYARLMDGAAADIMWTDPPYGVDYVGRTDKKLVLQNDQRQGLLPLLKSAFANCFTVMKEGAPFYVAHAPGINAMLFAESLTYANLRITQSLVWVKDVMVVGHSDYHYKHEPILYGNKPLKEGRFGRGGIGWYGGNAAVSVFEIERPKASDKHPTAKPAALVEAHLENSSESGSIVLDPFVGSGTTLIAADRLGRVCYAMDRDPVYAEVTVRRWQEWSGEQAILADTGETYDQVVERKSREPSLVESPIGVTQADE